MNQSTPDEVERFLEQYGWTYRPHGRGVWMSGWASDLRSYPLKIIWDESFVELAIQPFYKLDFDWEAYPDISTWLLELSDNYKMIKVSIDQVGDLVLSLVMINHNLDYIRFSTGLGILGYYADIIYDEISEALDQSAFESKIPIS